MDSTSSSTSAASLAAEINAMNFLQQLSQLMFFQSLVSANAADGGNEGKASMFDFTKLQQQSSPLNEELTPISPKEENNDDDGLKYLQTISDLLSSPQNLKSEFSTPTLPSDSLKMYNNDFGFDSLFPTTLPSTTPSPSSRQYKIPVNRESAKPLQEWMNQHITDPYPTQKDVQQLSLQTGFTFKQVRNWFTNSRRRYEQQFGTNALPWIKKEAPKTIVCQKILSNESSTPSPSSEGCESS